MTRSEEQLRVRTESLPVGRVRLRKHIVTEYEQVTVPVQREEIRLEQEPIGGPGGPVAEVDSVAGGAIGDQVPGQVGAGDEHEVVLHAERPVVRTETVPVERVRMGKQTVPEHQQVDGQVRKKRSNSTPTPTPARADKSPLTRRRPRPQGAQIEVDDTDCVGARRCDLARPVASAGRLRTGPAVLVTPPAVTSHSPATRWLGIAHCSPPEHADLVRGHRRRMA